eukprot:tig00001416_g8955.t1
MQVSNHPTKGRVLLAARRFSEGEVVLLDPGLVRCPHARREPVCGHCCDYIDGPVASQCESCGLPFCGAECVEAAKAYHGLECGLLAAGSLDVLAEELDVSRELLWLGLRALLRDAADARRAAADADGAADGAGRPEPLRDAVASLECAARLAGRRGGAGARGRQDARGADRGEYRERLGRAADALAAAFACEAEGLPEGDLARALPASAPAPAPPRAPAPSLSAAGRRSACGTGIFVQASLFSHSCDAPNCHYQGERGAVAVRAAREVAEGEELTIAYVALDRWTAVRRIALLRRRPRPAPPRPPVGTGPAAEGAQQVLPLRVPALPLPSELGRYTGAARCKLRGCAGYLLQRPYAHPAGEGGGLPEPAAVLEQPWACEACGTPAEHAADLRRASAFLDKSDEAWHERSDVAAAAEWCDRFLGAAAPALLHPLHTLTGRALSHRMKQAALLADFDKAAACAERALERIAVVFPEARSLERAELQFDAALAFVMGARKLPEEAHRAALARSEALLAEAEGTFAVLAGRTSKRLANMRREYAAIRSHAREARAARDARAAHAPPRPPLPPAPPPALAADRPVASYRTARCAFSLPDLDLDLDL